jgi:phosphoribosylglycinamide formyltransferase-1
VLTPPLWVLSSTVRSFDLSLARAGTVRVMSIAVLASGAGTILEAMIAADLPITVVVVDRPCGAEAVAAQVGVEVLRVLRQSFGPDFDRDAFTTEVVAALLPFGVELLAMAGYGTVLGPGIHEAYPGRILNTHPALLPQFKGWHAVSEALSAGVAETGCTVHVATLEVDDGPILAQEVVKIRSDDTSSSLHERIKAVERRLYPAAIRAYLDERLTPDGLTACGLTPDALTADRPTGD